VTGRKDQAGWVYVVDSEDAAGVVLEVMRHGDQLADRVAGTRRGVDLLDDGDGPQDGVEQVRVGVEPGAAIGNHRAYGVGRGNVCGVLPVVGNEGHAIAQDGELALGELRLEMGVGEKNIAIEAEEVTSVSGFCAAEDGVEAVDVDGLGDGGRFVPGRDDGDAVGRWLR
jgi:hypothetical protein